MKWIPLTERKPIDQSYVTYTNGEYIKSGFYDSRNWSSSFPKDVTHWLEFTPPPLPKKECDHDWSMWVMGHEKFYKCEMCGKVVDKKPKDPDFEKLLKEFDRFNKSQSDLGVINMIYEIVEFIKAKYG